jgi:CubicO group peptidase (beta-lactamase class C family)
MTIPTVTPEAVGMSSARLARIAPGIQRWIDRGTITGAAMLIARRNKLAYAAELGTLGQGVAPSMPADALFRIYSMTKPIICTALMTFFEEGRFQLITPLETFMPAFKGMKVLTADPAGNASLADAARPIFVGDLMKHTAGFTYDFLVDSPVGDLYRQARLANNADRTLEEFAAALAEMPLAYQPGSRWHYGLGIDVAAHLIQILADRPLRDVLQERIFTPLGMVDTDFCVPDVKQGRLARMYGADDICGLGVTHRAMFDAWGRGVWQPLDVSETYPVDRPETFQRGGHGLFSTAPDYLRFAQALLNNGALDDVRILGRKTVELMHANHIAPELLPYEINGWPSPGYGFGLGSRVLMDVGASGVPGTLDEFGWAGAASTYYWIDPAEAMVGVFMTQYQGFDMPPADFRALAYQAIVD